MGSLRLFVAVSPPQEVVARLLAALETLDLPAHRIVPPEQVHLTLHFMGAVDPRELDDVVESVGRSAAGLPAFALAPLRLVGLPARGPQRLVAAETDAPATLLEIQRRLVVRLARAPAAAPATGSCRTSPCAGSTRRGAPFPSPSLSTCRRSRWRRSGSCGARCTRTALGTGRSPARRSTQPEGPRVGKFPLWRATGAAYTQVAVTEHPNWRRLETFERLHEARAIATSAASMGFDVRLVDVRSGRVDEHDADADAAPTPDGGGPWALETPADDWAELAPALAHIIDEQSEFDARLEVRDRSSLRAQRVFLGVLIAIVAVLATLGIIRL